MKFDTVIIGGGLSGLSCGIRLQQSGAATAIVSAGQSALHFSSGSFDLLNRLPDGTPVANPVDGAAKLPSTHPYAKIGAAFAAYAQAAKKHLLDCGVGVEGTEEQNALHFTPVGTLKPSWLTVSDFDRYGSPAEIAGKSVVVANFAGFLDFNTKFIVDALETAGAACRVEKISIPALDHLRVSPTEMRSTNLAKAIDANAAVFGSLVEALKKCSAGADMVALPAVVGLASDRLVKTLKEEVPAAVLMPTMPPSVAGIRAQQTLRREYERLGGVFMLGDSVVGADMEGGSVKSVTTVNHADISLRADNFVLASGSFFSNGLVARSSEIVEPVFGLDVDYAADRSEWYDPRFFSRQNYMSYGVATDSDFRVKKGGAPIANLYAAGSVLSGFNPVYEGCGGGVALLTALYVADQLKKSRQ